MRHPRITVAAITVAIAAAVGGVTIASASGSTSLYGSGSSTPRSSSGSVALGAATVQTATVSVKGTPETILEDGKGMPLYIYQPDSPTSSRVSGQLAALWPPLIAKAPTAAGATGMLQSLTTSNGQQVSYNGHFLYTFVEDGPGHVTGQGVQNFFVATPDLPLQGATPAAATTPSPAATSNNYSYGSGY